MKSVTEARNAHSTTANEEMDAFEVDVVTVKEDKD